MIIFGRKRFEEEVNRKINEYQYRMESEERIRDIERRIWKMEDEIRTLRGDQVETPVAPVENVSFL